MLEFNRSSLAGKELDFVVQSIQSGQISGDRKFSRDCESLLQKFFGERSTVKITTSCTHALEMTGLLLDLKPGDEVIVPSFTFVSSASAFSLRGATIKFADIREDTLNIDETKLDHLITARTKAIVVVHYAGVGCEMDEIESIARKHGIDIIEDNAHGLFGKYKGRPLGTIGRFATQSFHETKNITCGEGGALVLNEPSDVGLAEMIREKGTNRAEFFRGEVNKYGWKELGSSYVMSDILAAFLFGQLSAWESIQTRRQAIWTNYNLELSDWARQNNVRRPFVPAYCDQAYHMFQLRFPDRVNRDAFISHLKRQQVHAVFHYLPLHESEYSERMGWNHCDCPVTSHVSDTLVRLPFFHSMTESEQNKVIEATHSFECTV